MENKKLTWSNFWQKSRFWRHVIVWILFFLLFLMSELYINSLYRSNYEILSYSIVNTIMYIAGVYISFYLFKRFYRNHRRFLFFLWHIPIFFSIAFLGRMVATYANLDYDTSIWVEIINWPVTMAVIYLVRFGYHGLKTKWEMKKLKTQYNQTISNLSKTQIDPQFLIQKLEFIHQKNIEDTHLANEAILELADDLRQRLDTFVEREIPLESIPPIAIPTTNTQDIKDNKNYSRIKRHLLVWLLFTLFVLLNQFNQFSDDWLSWFYTIPKKMLGIYAFALLIYPSLYVYKLLALNKKYLLFIGSQLAILFSFILFLFFLRQGIGSPKTTITFGMLFVSSSMVLAGAYLTQISYTFFKEKSTLNALEAKQMEMELRLLKAQINPHFLFNILNNIYGTNLENSAKANKYIEDLINLLQYQNSSQKKPYISLSEEIQIVKNYIDLEKARVHNCKVHLEEEGDFSKFKIIPLLLLPLIENAFKYGTGVSNGDINIRLEQVNNQFQFSCSNRIMPNKTQKTSTGIGLDNVQKRLLIRYPNKHRFIIDHTQDIFTAKVNIAL